ncbi:unnamed protein product [Paramecium pentaurelia]|uniref:Cilia- and flagella-associated protein 99 n=1 Tax=Paramecium pentaurelia TaxID=43138 RepID=A0A8S1WZQ2_9CILI|nr:unnamed protein product [Paramecium pentaurelia]
MRYQQLITQAIDLIKSYNPVILTPDSYCEQYIQENCKKLFDTEIMFLKQVFSGVQRYEEFLKILTKTMFKILSSTTNRNDGTLYHIFSYLIIFRLDELPYNEFKKMVNEQDPVKMNVLLQFLFDIDKIQTHLKPLWIEIYDPQYIQETVIGGLEQHFPMMKDLLSSLSSRATGKQSELVEEEERPQSATKKQPTKTIPFKLSETKKKPEPPPPPKPEQYKSKPVPNYLNKRTLSQVEEENKQRLEQSKKKVQDTYKEAKQFEFKTEQRPTNYEIVKKEVEDTLNKQLQFNMKYAKPVPTELEAAEIKLNAAAILREEMLLKKKQDIEKERVKNLEVNLRDSGEFEEWKKQQDEIEQIAKMEHQQQKKIEMELAREAAMRAQEEKFKENRILAEKMKEEAIERLKERQELQQEQVEYKKQLIEQIIEAEKKVHIQVEKVQERNKQMAEDQKLEMARKLELKRQEDEQIRIKREELIKQIRELERQPIKRTKGYDPTETMGYGLLEEMSLAELRDRLEVVKAERKAEEEEKRKEIVQSKDEYLSSMQKKVLEIKAHRRAETQQKNMEREAKKLKKQKEEELRKKIREEQLIEVQNKISQKKQIKSAEEQRIAAEVRETKLRQQYMNANKAMVEMKAWKSQQDGLEREIKNRQNEKLIVQEGIESVNLKERKILAEQAKRLVKTKVDFNQAYDKELKTAYQMNEELYQQEAQNRTQMHNIQREWKEEHTKNMISRDEYKQKISETSLKNSKKKSQQQKIKFQQSRQLEQLPSAQY